MLSATSTATIMPCELLLLDSNRDNDRLGTRADVLRDDGIYLQHPENQPRCLSGIKNLGRFCPPMVNETGATGDSGLESQMANRPSEKPVGANGQLVNRPFLGLGEWNCKSWRGHRSKRDCCFLCFTCPK